MLQVGVFRIHQKIGRGAAATVWAAEHIHSGTQAAVKILTVPNDQGHSTAAAFRREVQATARLNHHGIIELYEYGELGDVDEDEDLKRGAPYLAMELATTTLRQWLRARKLAWNDTKTILIDLLDALAHAHARGIIHRDLKPDNVLGFGGDGALHWKIADFGISHPVDVEAFGTIGPFSGTPKYMPPEQIRGLWRDYGPWTDLYALGCMAYEMVADRHPFDGATLAELVVQHITATPPLLEVDRAVPPGFGDWVQRLLKKSWHERFETAADAKLALLDLGPPEPGAWYVEPRSGKATVPTNDALVLHQGLPNTWRTTADERRVHTMAGVGLGLYGMRSGPLVGRDALLDRMWDTLFEAAEAEQVRVLMIEGQAGVGKSRLAEWFCQRAQELGAAEVFRATHSLEGGPSDGLSPMLAHHLRCTNLSRAEALERSTSLLANLGIDDPAEAELLTDVALPNEAHKTPSVELFRTTLARHFALHCQRRPVIVWLDDVQWSTGSLAFMGEVSSSHRLSNVPMLFVATIELEDLSQRPAATAMLETLKERPEVAVLKVDNLGPNEAQQLASNLLGFHHSLAARLARQSRGNPLFACQLVEDWQRQDLFEIGPGGLTFREGVAPEIPASLSVMWRLRVERFLAARDPSDRLALEIAAALGPEIHLEEWNAVCALAVVTPSEDLLEAMVGAHLGRWTYGGWAFIHGLLARSIEAASRAAQRNQRWHELSAQVIAETRADRLSSARHYRVGISLMKAGHLTDAFDAFMAAAKVSSDEGQYAAVDEIIDLAEYTLSSLEAPDGDSRWGAATVMRARSCKERGAFDRTLELCAAVIDAGLSSGWLQPHLTALLLSAAALGRLARYDEARAAYANLEQLASAHKRKSAQSFALAGLGKTAVCLGDFETAKTYCYHAYEVAVRSGDSSAIAEAIWGLAVTALSRGDAETAGEYYREAVTLNENLGNETALTHALVGVAEVHRLQGELDEAEQLYRRGLARYERLGSPHVDITLGNLGLVCLARRDFEGARSSLEQSRTASIRSHSPTWEAVACCNLLPCLAHDEDWAQWDLTMRRATELISGLGVTDPDSAWCAALGGEVASARGHVTEAREAYALSLTLWTQLGRTREMTEVQRALDALDAEK